MGTDLFNESQCIGKLWNVFPGRRPVAADHSINLFASFLQDVGKVNKAEDGILECGGACVGTLKESATKMPATLNEWTELDRQEGNRQTSNDRE